MGIIPWKLTAAYANEALPPGCNVCGNKKSKLCRCGRDRDCIIRECNVRQVG